MAEPINTPVDLSTQPDEEQMAEPMTTPVVSASQPVGKDHCNEIENNEKCISIITSHLYLY